MGGTTLQLVQNIKPIRVLFCTTGSCSDLGIYLIYNIYKFHKNLRTFLDSLHFTHFTSLTFHNEERKRLVTRGWRLVQPPARVPRLSSFTAVDTYGG